MKNLFLFLATIFFTVNSYSQVVINEYSASNLTVFVDSYEAYDDWVELRNIGNGPVDISNWYLSDKFDNPTKWQLPESIILESGEVRLIVCSGRDLVTDGEIHTNFKLQQTTSKDQLILSDNNGNEVHATTLMITDADYSVLYDEGEWKPCPTPTPNDHVATVFSYDRQAQAPTIQLEAGFYEGTQVVSVINNEPNSVLRYTTNGNDVSASDPVFPMTLSISNTTLLKVKAFSEDSNVLASRLDFATYFIDEDFTLPVFSIGSDDVLELANGNAELEPIASIEYFNEAKQLESISYGEMNSHGKGSWGNNHRSLDFICRDEMGYSRAIESKLFVTSDRDQFQRLMFRASGDDNYPARESDIHDGSTHIRDEYVQTLAVEGGLELDCRKVQRAIVFLNGQYWGVYGLREKVADHDYTQEYYDQGKYDIDFLSHWGGTLETYNATGAKDNWALLRDFVLNNDMSDVDNYIYAEEQLDMLSMIDYFLLNLNVVAADWLTFNTAWWRGNNSEGKHKKWGFTLWDMDATFDYHFNFTGIPNTNYDATPCDIDSPMSNSWGLYRLMFLKLLDENPDFRKLYFNRYSDLTNTAFSCENMLATFDRMVAVIELEMPRQIDRWGGSMEEWNGNIDSLRLYIENRCELINQGAIECYDELDETHHITLITEPDGIGEIDFNTLDIESFPWEGDYFGGVSNEIKAKVFDENEDDWVFSHWESKSQNEILPDVNTRKANITMTTSDTLVAVFAPITGLKEITNLVNLELYPNPATNSINLDFDLVQSGVISISILDLMGRELYTEQINNAQSGFNQWTKNLSDLNLVNGVYIVNLKMNDQKLSRRVNVMR